MTAGLGAKHPLNPNTGSDRGSAYLVVAYAPGLIPASCNGQRSGPVAVGHLAGHESILGFLPERRPLWREVELVLELVEFLGTEVRKRSCPL